MISTTDVPPNQTLFCYNLTTKHHVNDLRSLLFEFCSPYGKVIDVVASRTDPKKRGNAFVVFSDISAATTAFRSLQGREFLGRPIGINYAKTKSDRAAQLDGTFKVRKRKAAETPPVADTTTISIPQPKKLGVSIPVGARLFVENLPPIMTEAALSILFRQYPGFQEARLIEGRAVAFIDFANELQAEVALRGLNGFLVTPECPLTISIAKK